ncbi:MAG: hypothetical protein HFH39_03810 [Lachnospiraceae bacterium]|nr:hypothetical protein [Lachnospiraceae bacterium]
MDRTTFSFDLVDKYTPDIVIKKSLKQIEEATKGYVAGHVEEYGGPISSYKKMVSYEQLVSAQTEQIDIQNDLGNQNDQVHKFEVFLTVKGLEYYKYRMMFVGYGSISYPVTIVMDEKLAAVYKGRLNKTFFLGSMQQVEEMMDLIINSDTMISFLQNLINESIRRENMDINIG